MIIHKETVNRITTLFYKDQWSFDEAQQGALISWVQCSYFWTALKFSYFFLIFCETFLHANGKNYSLRYQFSLIGILGI